MGLDDDDLRTLQVMIMVDPIGSPVVQGTGGLRKLRFAPKRWNTGKRGAARICYVYYEEYGIVLLVLAYSKNQSDDLSPDQRKTIKDVINLVQQHLENGVIQ